MRQVCLRADGFLDRCLLGVRGEVSAWPTPRALVDLADLVRREVRLLASARASGRARVRRRLERARLWGDAESLRSAVGNLVGKP